jgi:uncharacterized membrane protein
MRFAVAAAALLIFAVVAIMSFGKDPRNMYTPVYMPTRTSGQVQYVQPAYVHPTTYLQPGEHAPADSFFWMCAFATAGAVSVATVVLAVRDQPTSVADVDIVAATSAARVATLAVTGHKSPAPKKNVYASETAQQRFAERALNAPMNFDGWLPETVNGRLAQVGFVAAIAGEVTTKQTLTEQFQSNFDAFAITATLVMLGSVAPSVQRTLIADYDESGKRVPAWEEATKNTLLALFKTQWAQPKTVPAMYTSQPKTISLSEDPFGIFKSDSEIYNNRGALIGIAAMLATEYITKQPIFMLAVEGEEVSANKKDKATSRSGPKGVKAMGTAGARENPMNFNGWAPEVINGRLAQLSIVAAVQSEISTGQTLAEQFQNDFSAFGALVLLVSVASFAPSLQQAITKDLRESKSLGFASDWKTIVPSEEPFGIFKETSEMANSRAAMVGVAAMLATELVIKRPIFMLGVDGKEAAELTDSHAKLRAWAESAGAKLLADERAVALLGLGGAYEDPEDDELTAMGFSEVAPAIGVTGWAPDVINGRLAQAGFLTALGTEALNSGEKLADQFVDNFPLFAGSVLAVVAASFAPGVVNQEGKYMVDPKSIDPKEDPSGIFSYTSEMTNSRAAMVGIAAMLLTEQLLQRPLVMFGVEGKATPADTELNERLSAWAAEAGAELVADEEKVAMLFTSGTAATPKMALKSTEASATRRGGLFSVFSKGGTGVKRFQ